MESDQGYDPHNGIMVLVCALSCVILVIVNQLYFRYQRMNARCSEKIRYRYHLQYNFWCVTTVFLPMNTCLYLFRWLRWQWVDVTRRTFSLSLDHYPIFSQAIFPSLPTSSTHTANSRSKADSVCRVYTTPRHQRGCWGAKNACKGLRQVGSSQW